MPQNRSKSVADLLEVISQHYFSIPAYVQIVRRDKNGCVTHRAMVPIRYITPDYNEKGIGICIEESEITFEVDE